MAKFLLGLVVGVVISFLYSSYFTGRDLNDLTYKARAAVANHMPVHN